MNRYGYQQALSGKAYTGIYTYDGVALSYKEYLTRSITPLVIGSTYEVSIFVSLANSSTHCTDDLGVRFYDNGPTATIGPSQEYLPVTPHVSFSSYGLIRDTLDWVELKGTFIADSAYDNIIIGGFGDPAHTHQTKTGVDTTFFKYAYYYVDSVTLVLKSKMGLLPGDSVRCGADTIKQSFTTAAPLGTGNIFSLELSDSSGSFASANVIGTLAGTTGSVIKGIIPPGTVEGLHYRMRIRASTPADTVGPGNYFSLSQTLPGTISASSNAPVCSGNTLNLNAVNSTPGAHYLWTGPHNFRDTFLNTSIPSATYLDSGLYTVTAWLEGCKLSAVVNGNVNTARGEINITVKEPVCQGDTLIIHANPKGTFSGGQWTGPNGFSAATPDASIVHPPFAASGRYIFNGFFNGCPLTDTIDVHVKPSPQYPGGKSNTPVCAGDTLMLTANVPDSGTTISWQGPLNFNSATTDTIFYDAQPSLTGKYILTADLNGCQSIDTVKVTVKPMPVAPLGNSNSPVQAGNVLKLMVDNAVNDVLYTWTGPNAFHSLLPNPALNSVSTQNTGMYIVTAALEECITADTILVTIIPGEKDSSYIKVFPNANNGNFTILALTLRDQLVPFNITADNGQLVYKASVLTKNRLLNVNVNLKDVLASAIYTLNIFIDGKKYGIKILVVRN